MVTAVSIFGLVMGLANIAVHRKSMGLWFWLGIGLVVVSALSLARLFLGGGAGDV